MDNSRMHPSSGVIKLWEKNPEEVERLFNELLAETRDIHTVQNKMDSFIDEYEHLRQDYFPGNWSYKHDRHSVSIFLAMNDPDFNYVFKSSEAHAMARYTDFGFTIGAGGSFSLENYYLLCDSIVQALKEHESLLEKHFSRLTDRCYYDESLHLLVFDLMYCCRTYEFYQGLVAPVTGKTVRKAVIKKNTPEDAEKKEEERRSRIMSLEQELSELERSITDVVEISLIGVQVNSNIYGVGTIVAQDANRVTVQFAEVEKAFVLDKKYAGRPRFEDDETIIEAFTEYSRAQEKIKKIQRELGVLRAERK